ncbi:MAG TPA: SDR family oxidoreductase [Dehalococcoidia bacterium]|nr:SDR family oxidoreductase [Dehalococcoidia bacterium]
MATGNGTLAGKVAIITGGGTGLGKMMALLMAKEGADIVVAARRIGAIEQTADEVREIGPRALAIPTDVTDPAQVNNLVERTLVEMGGLDILVNNAGIVRGQERRPLWEVTDEEWRIGIDTNLSGAFYCCRAAIKHFVDQGHGKIINIASGNGMRGNRGDFMYGTAKAGVINFTRVLATTFAQDNIQINCIAPGFVNVRELQPEPSTRGSFLTSDFIPVGRIGVPEDIGHLALFLASDASDYITGALFANDGGGLAGGVSPTGYAPVIAMEED